MRTLSLWRPWPWAFLHAGKRIENRPHYIHYRGNVIWQAAKRFDAESVPLIQRESLRSGQRLMCPGEPTAHPAGVLSFIGEIVDCVTRDEAVRNAESGRFSVYGEVGKPHNEQGFDWASQRGWIFGPWCAVVLNIRPITETIPWKGSQGWFDVPPEVVAKWL